MQTAQLVVLFATGFLLSRAMIAARLPDRFVMRLLAGGKGVSAIVWRLVFAAAFLSLLIPNAVTVLTLLPVLRRLQLLLARRFPEKQKTLGTLLALSLIYGANIGGMGSVTATPANGILVAYLQLSKAAGSASVHFATWLTWGLPLVLATSSVASGVLIAAFRSWRFQLQSAAGEGRKARMTAHERAIWWVAAAFVAAATALSLLMLQSEDKTLWLSVTIAAGLLVLAVLFLLPVGRGDERRRLLQLREIFGEMPWRGLVFVAGAMLVAFIAYAVGAHRWLTAQVEALAHGLDAGPFALLFAVALGTSLGTEVLSNTAVQLAVFTVGPALASASGGAISLAGLLTVVTLSCTCAFMSPIATGVNGLAFGGARDVSLMAMLSVGAIMNVAAALLIAGWARWVIPW
jgi:sodium-dependent dicarboxylate transporter 2/3/5